MKPADPHHCDGLGGHVRSVRLWEALGGKLPFPFGSTGKVCLDRSRPLTLSFSKLLGIVDSRHCRSAYLQIGLVRFFVSDAVGIYLGYQEEPLRMAPWRQILPRLQHLPLRGLIRNDDQAQGNLREVRRPRH